MYDAERIDISDHRAQESKREARLRRRQHQIDILEATTSAEDILYRPGIDNSV